MINWSQVHALRSEVGEEDFDEVISLFLEEVQEVVDGLTSAPSDRSELESKMHFLKGSALNLGFDAFSSLCAEGEKNAAAGHAEDVDVGAVLACYSASRAMFLKDIEVQCQAS